VDPLYAFVQVVGRFWIWFFFKAVEVRHPELVPRTGPVLLCINHPNNLIDSLLVGAVVPRKVHYLAAARFFRNPLLASFLTAVGVIAIYRRQDDPIFAYGAAVNALPYLVPRWIAHRVTTEETDYATARFLSSIVLIPLFWGLETWLVWRLSNLRIAALFLVSLPVSGLLAYRYLGGLSRLRSQLRFSRLALIRNQAARQLLAQRQQIFDELERAKSDYLVATRGSSF